MQAGFLGAQECWGDRRIAPRRRFPRAFCSTSMLRHCADLTPPTFAQTTRRTKCLAAKLSIQSYPRTSWFYDCSLFHVWVMAHQKVGRIVDRSTSVRLLPRRPGAAGSFSAATDWSKRAVGSKQLHAVHARAKESRKLLWISAATKETVLLTSALYTHNQYDACPMWIVQQQQQQQQQQCWGLRISGFPKATQHLPLPRSPSFRPNLPLCRGRVHIWVETDFFTIRIFPATRWRRRWWWWRLERGWRWQCWRSWQRGLPWTWARFEQRWERGGVQQQPGSGLPGRVHHHQPTSKLLQYRHCHVRQLPGSLPYHHRCCHATICCEIKQDFPNFVVERLIMLLSHETMALSPFLCEALNFFVKRCWSTNQHLKYLTYAWMGLFSLFWRYLWPLVPFTDFTISVDITCWNFQDLQWLHLVDCVCVMFHLSPNFHLIISSHLCLFSLTMKQWQKFQCLMTQLHHRS